MIIALSVTTVCVICTVIIIVCCFWSQCPLYTACRIRYHQDDIIAYGKIQINAPLYLYLKVSQSHEIQSERFASRFYQMLSIHYFNTACM